MNFKITCRGRAGVVDQRAASHRTPARRGFNEGILFSEPYAFAFEPHPGHIISDTVNLIFPTN